MEAKRFVTELRFVASVWIYLLLEKLAKIS
jgi:hypothetical protein